MALIIAINVVVIVSLVGLAFLRDLESGLPLLTVFLILLPLESRIPIPGLFDLTSSRLAILVFAGLYLALRPQQRSLGLQQDLPLKSLMLLTIMWALVSTANSIVFTTSLKTVLSQICDFYLLYYLFLKTITKRETVHKIFVAVVASIVVCCVDGFLEIRYHWNVLSLFPTIQSRTGLAVGGLIVDEERGLRLSTVFPHPILYGAALVFAISIALYLLGIAKRRTQKAFLWLAIIAMFYDTYKTVSRGPWLALILSLVLLLCFSSGNTRKNLAAIFLLIAAALLIRPGVTQAIENQYSATFNVYTAEGVSYEGRWVLLHMCEDVVAKDFSREVWGYGPESFFFLHLTGLNGEGHVVPITSCDSSWFEAIAETGYVGLLLLFALITRPILITYRSFRQAASPDRGLYGVLVVNQVAFAFLMTNVACYGWGQQSSMLWILVAVAMAYPRLSLNEHATRDLDVYQVTTGRFAKLAASWPRKA